MSAVHKLANTAKHVLFIVYHVVDIIGKIILFDHQHNVECM